MLQHVHVNMSEKKKRKKKTGSSERAVKTSLFSNLVVFICILFLISQYLILNEFIFSF